VRAARLVSRRPGGPPTYTYEPVPGVPAVTVVQLVRDSMGSLEDDAHSHDFLLLNYYERGGGSLRLAGREWHVRTGDVYLVAPGEVVGAGKDAQALADTESWAVFFPVEVFGSQAPGAFLSWRTHPLLYPFVRGSEHGVHRVNVPAADRPSWSARLSALDAELRERRDGYTEAVLAHLTLLLVEVSRLAADVVGDLRVRDQPFLADVFAFIERHYGEPISLRDVARSVNLSPGHLTTVVRRATGRTVLGWITERRMTAARHLLATSDLSVADVGGSVGYGDPSYFVRSFRRAHGTTPLEWRRASRS
jgi:AraC family transcriptional regulator, transcriptional activator of pobA